MVSCHFLMTWLNSIFQSCSSSLLLGSWVTQNRFLSSPICKRWNDIWPRRYKLAQLAQARVDMVIILFKMALCQLVAWSQVTPLLLSTPYAAREGRKAVVKSSTCGSVRLRKKIGVKLLDELKSEAVHCGVCACVRQSVISESAKWRWLHPWKLLFIEVLIHLFIISIQIVIYCLAIALPLCFGFPQRSDWYQTYFQSEASPLDPVYVPGVAAQSTARDREWHQTYPRYARSCVWCSEKNKLTDIAEKTLHTSITKSPDCLAKWKVVCMALARTLSKVSPKWLASKWWVKMMTKCTSVRWVAMLNSRSAIVKTHFVSLL